MLEIFSAENFWVTLKIDPRAAGSGSKYANHCAMLLPENLITLIGPQWMRMVLGQPKKSSVWIPVVDRLQVYLFIFNKLPLNSR